MNKLCVTTSHNYIYLQSFHCDLNKKKRKYSKNCHSKGQYSRAWLQLKYSLNIWKGCMFFLARLATKIIPATTC